MTGEREADPASAIPPAPQPRHEELLRALQEAMRAGDANGQAAALAALRDALGEGGGAAASATGATAEVPPIDWSTEPTPVFANGLQILHRATDFAVIFTDHTPFPGRHAAGRQAGAERATVVCSLRTHPAAFFQMVCAMASNWNRFATTMIDPRMRQPRFRLFDAGELQLEQAPSISSEE
jgi:hypothetical protein